MRWSLMACVFAVATALAADSNPTVAAKAADLEVTARLITDKQAMINAIGSDLKRQYVIVELTVKPRGGYPVVISREDFLLRSERDNERATAESPERIVGSAVLVLGPAGANRAPVYGQSGDPVFVGGLPGMGGRPRRIGGQDGAVGSGTTGASESTVAAGKDSKESPLVAKLQEKELPLGETGKPVSGYLYFSVDPQQKTKNFHLHYKGPGGTCELRFH